MSISRLSAETLHSLCMCTTVFDCNEKRHDSSPGNCPNHLLLPFSPLVSLVQESTPLLSHSSAARGHTLRFRGVNPTKQTIIPRGVFLRKPRTAEESTSQKHPSHGRNGRRLSLPSGRQKPPVTSRHNAGPFGMRGSSCLPVHLGPLGVPACCTTGRQHRCLGVTFGSRLSCKATRR